MQRHYRKISAADLHYVPASRVHPADTYFHFSFANYHNPENMRFGVLRVFNDDDVKPHKGFGKHPHEDMEIVSYVVKGKLSHWDSATKTKEVMARGHVQTVTAGTGVWHSEENKEDEWTRFLQIWILPPARGLAVRYENHKFEPEQRRNRLLQIVGNSLTQETVPLHLNQDVNMFVSELTQKKAAVSYTLQSGRQAYINNFEGSVDVKDYAILNERDSLEIKGPTELVFSVIDEQAHFIIIEMAEMKVG